MALNNRKTLVVIVGSVLLTVLFTARAISHRIETIPVDDIEQFPVGSFEVHAFLEQHNGG
jgi:vancomycin permeability regulator SanA